MESALDRFLVRHTPHLPCLGARYRNSAFEISKVIASTARRLHMRGDASLGLTRTETRISALHPLGVMRARHASLMVEPADEQINQSLYVLKS